MVHRAFLWVARRGCPRNSETHEQVLRDIHQNSVYSIVVIIITNKFNYKFIKLCIKAYPTISSSGLYDTLIISKNLISKNLGSSQGVISIMDRYGYMIKVNENSICYNQASSISFDTISTGTNFSMNDNNFQNSISPSEFQIKGYRPQNSRKTFSIANNWWGVTDSASVKSRISNGTGDTLVYQPFLTSPSLTAPAMTTP